MDLAIDNLQTQVCSSISEGNSIGHNKTALTLLEQIQHLVKENSADKTKKVLEIAINEKAGIMVVNGVDGPVKIFSHNKLLLIRSANNDQAHFNIGHLKKGRYLLEAEHRFFEFVR